MARSPSLKLRLYLAGPEVFRPDVDEEGRRLLAICEAAGAEGLFPAEFAGGDIRRNCIGMIEQADALIANISPFRGSHMDPGTAFEIGYAEALGKPAFLWSDDSRPLDERIPISADGRDSEGMRVETFGKPENLMIVPDGITVWRRPEEAVAAAMAALEHTRKNRALQRSTRRAVLIAAVVSLAVAFASGMLFDFLVG